MNKDIYLNEGLKVTIDGKFIVFESEGIWCRGTCEFIEDSENNNAHISLSMYRDKRKNKTYKSRRYLAMKHMEKWFYSQCCKLKELGYL